MKEVTDEQKLSLFNDMCKYWDFQMEMIEREKQIMIDEFITATKGKTVIFQCK